MDAQGSATADQARDRRKAPRPPWFWPYSLPVLVTSHRGGSPERRRGINLKCTVDSKKNLEYKPGVISAGSSLFSKFWGQGTVIFQLFGVNCIYIYINHGQ